MYVGVETADRRAALARALAGIADAGIENRPVPSVRQMPGD